jgi:uncharacterized protein YbcV (DUF1398 family)
MNSEQAHAIKECAALSAAGSIHFGEVIARLSSVGVERYHADYSRCETTYYATDGSSCIVPMAHDPAPIADRFSAADIETAVRMSQRGEIKYPQFTSRALAAGCVGYFVLLTGRCVQYFGRKGETHTEWFPGAVPPHGR